MNITVIGAGVIGLLTSYELLNKGHDVTILDSAPASGATHHAGGMLAPAAEVVYQQDPLFPLMKESNRLYPELVRGLECGYRTDGTLLVAADRADAQALHEMAEYQRQHGMNVEKLTLRQARKLESALSPRLSGVVHLADDHQVSPRALAASLIDALGSRIRREPAQYIDGARVHTPSGSIDSDHVVLANGLGASALCPINLKLRPVYGDILRLNVPPHQRPLLNKVVRGHVEGRPIYIIPRRNHTLTVGATSREDERPHPSVGGIHSLLRDAIRLVPAIEECDFLEFSVGARPGTPDDLPYLGRISEHLTISTGYFRHGILLAALAARVTSELVEERPTSVNLNACDPWRHHQEQRS